MSINKKKDSYGGLAPYEIKVSYKYLQDQLDIDQQNIQHETHCSITALYSIEGIKINLMKKRFTIIDEKDSPNGRCNIGNCELTIMNLDKELGFIEHLYVIKGYPFYVILINLIALIAVPTLTLTLYYNIKSMFS